MLLGGAALTTTWAGRVEAAYVSADVLGGAARGDSRYPQLEREGELVLAPLESGRLFQGWTLREQGVVIAGPAPRALVARVQGIGSTYGELLPLPAGGRALTAPR